ncbi:vitellogenin-2 protein [Spatholobus suberectus]|nr:vitellogenin-2 protein [Spatholobus suberectus]
MLDPRTQRPNSAFQLYDGTRHRPHTTWEARNSSLWPSKPAFAGTDEDDSGICSPPMWTTSPPHRKNHYRSLSPTSRTQAIARGQRELMEMVKDMPESNYELSLKDLVEHHRQENVVEDRQRNLSVYKREKSGGGGVSRKVDKMAQVKRNGNIDRGGFYLKMVIPFSFGSKDRKKTKKKKNESSGSSGSRVTPKPSASDGSAKGGVDKEWWKKSPAVCRESDSGASSINSESTKSSGSSSSNSSSSRCNSRREKSGRRCWPFIHRRKSRTQK